MTVAEFTIEELEFGGIQTDAEIRVDADFDGEGGFEVDYVYLDDITLYSPNGSPVVLVAGSDLWNDMRVRFQQMADRWVDDNRSTVDEGLRAERIAEHC